MQEPKNAKTRWSAGSFAKLTDADTKSYHGVPTAQLVYGWERHAQWLLTRYQRSGKPRDWKAYMEHLAGMDERARRAVA
ncbi:MAG TPA: hypothetical protein VFQ78_05570 [Candidatus Udaeobacter sp.]|nr:hypothetical protein [Candidatus Udaeobacter sp.]HEU0273180.1 hypothetical protein [Candidatus Udaeobacter sp.]